LDEPGPGGANHAYQIGGFTHRDAAGGDVDTAVTLRFQNGPIKEIGTNGITHEVLIAIVIDRLKSFQAGQYACRENALALTKLEEAAHWLHHRTAERLARGVEGTHAK
jgi:hypothetical protein